MAASSINSTQFSPKSQLSQADSPRPQQAESTDPNEPARPQLGAAAQSITAPPSDSGRGRNVDVVA